jgi:hypothetical protein
MGARYILREYGRAVRHGGIVSAVAVVAKYRLRRLHC